MRGIEDGVLRDILVRAVGPDRAAVAFEAMSAPPSVSIRYNPFKLERAPFTVLPVQEGPRGSDASLRSAPPPSPKSSSELVRFPSSPSAVPPLTVPRVAWSSLPRPSYTRDEVTAEVVPWNEYGVMLRERPRFVLDPLFHAGCYYVQDSSAMVVGHIFREHLGLFGGLGRPVRVLDLCAAPGGKTTDLAASLRERFCEGFTLVANEVVRSRANVLKDNVEVWGDPNVIVTSADPKAIGRLEGWFDIILADVPCSGEGMFRKDPKAVEDWSPDNVRLCAARGKRILADAWPSLRCGGLLIYSTCTFEEAENDSAVEWAASELGAEVIDYEYSSLPGVIPTRTGGLLVPGFVGGEGQFVSALRKTSPSGASRLDPEALHPIRTGLDKGVLKGSDLVPSSAWALSIAPPVNIYPTVELDRETALRYLHRDGIFIEGQPPGFLLVCFEGHPLGFVKNIGRRWNNLHPAERRIRTDV